MTDLPQLADQLLDHATFLRRLAHHLAGPDDGDDLLQDAWVTSMRHPPTRGENLRGWFGAVLANVQRNRNRGKRRRVAHEAQAMAATVDRSAPAAAELAARDEVRQQVVAAVQQLPSDLRQVVMLRYYEGLDATAIGRHLDLAPSTVRTRLQAAMDRLRWRLDREHDGRRAAWAVPLASIAELPAPILTSAIGGRLGWFAAGAGLVATLLLATIWWPADAPLTTRTTQSAAAAPVPAAPAPAVGALDAAPTREAALPPAPTLPLAATTDRAPLATLHGNVQEGDSRRPLADLRIVVRNRAIDSGEFALDRATPPIERETVSAIDGNFSIPELPIGPYDVEAHGPGQLFAWGNLDLGIAPVQLQLLARPAPELGWVTVTAVDERGHPVAGADVTLAVGSRRAGWFGWGERAPMQGTTDGNGRFAVHDRPELAPIEEAGALVRDREGRVGITYWSRDMTMAPATIAVTLREPGSLVGTLTGLPDWRDVEVIGHPNLGRAFAATCFGMVGRLGADGSYRIDGLPAVPFAVQVRGLARRVDNEQYWNTTRTNVAAGEVTRCEPAALACVPGSRVVGVVTDADGKPVAFADVTARRAWVSKVKGSAGLLYHPESETAAMFALERTRTDAAGRYQLHLHPGEWQVVVRHRGLAIHGVPSLLAGNAPEFDLQHVLHPAASLGGRADSGLCLRCTAAPEVMHRVVEGTFLLHGLRIGNWELGQLVDGAFVAHSRIELMAGRCVWLAPDATVREYRGVLRHAGKPLAGYEVRLGNRGLPVTTGLDGSFVVRDHAPHDEDHEQLCIGYGTLKIASVEARDGIIELSGTLLEVHTTAADGSALPATIDIGDTFGDGGTLDKYEAYNGPGRCESPSGVLRFLLTERSEETSIIATFADGSRARAVLGDADRVTLVRPDSGRVQLTVKDLTGAPRSGCRVRVLAWGRPTPAPEQPTAFGDGCADPQEWVEGICDARGHVELRGVPTGSAMVTVWHDGTRGMAAHRIVAIRRDQTAVVELQVR